MSRDDDRWEQDRWFSAALTAARPSRHDTARRVITIQASSIVPLEPTEPGWLVHDRALEWVGTADADRWSAGA